MKTKDMKRQSRSGHMAEDDSFARSASLFGKNVFVSRIFCCD